MTGDEPLILCLDTATACSSVALARGTLKAGEVVAEISLNGDVTHSRRVIAGVDSLLKQTGIQWPDIDAVGVGLGPGSFTGLRIGLATAKGIAMAADKKMVGVSTLDGLAAMCPGDRRICAVIDARKKQVYRAFYHLRNGEVVREGEIRALSPERLVGEIDVPTVMIGDGARTYYELFKREKGRLICFPPAHLHAPSAAALALLCGARLLAGDVADRASCVPLYVRASDAELNLSAAKKDRAAR